MSSARALRPTPAWPFWLLLAAWLCANTPPGTIGGLLTWLGEAQRFSHQARLTRDVAFLLSGEEGPRTTVSAGPAENAPRPAAVATDGVFKKLDLACERSSHRLEPPRVTGLGMSRTRLGKGVPRPAPPHEPPRRLA